MPRRSLYGQSLALLTDLYQLTMAYGYWKSGLAEKEAVFHLFFRRAPFRGGFVLACGLAHVLDHLERFRFDATDLEYLAGLRGNDGAPLFEAAFLDDLGGMRLALDLDAVAEGTVMFPHQPLLRASGPILQCQILETPLLNTMNFESLIATKAARIVQAAGGDPVLEFGLRRAQGFDGALAASYAAYVGGAAATSNVLAGKLHGIPVRGTHAHSWVMLFDDELEAFETYAAALPNNCVFLVDTYDTLAGVRKAVEVGRRLRERGHEMVGIRLDSGDLAALSRAARRILDDGGFPGALIVASNDLDEHRIDRLRERGAAIQVWGVGTRLVTAHDEPALGGVFKLGAVRRDDGAWSYRLKVSDESAKTSNPGRQQVRRFRVPGGFLADATYNVESPPRGGWVVVDLEDPARRTAIPPGTPHTDLLEPVLRRGRCVYDRPDLDRTRAHARRQLAGLDPAVRQLAGPERYPAGLEAGLHALRESLVAGQGRA